MALESIILSPSTKTFTVQKGKVVQIAEGNSLCEPIRKQGAHSETLISPVKNATPSPAVCFQCTLPSYYMKFTNTLKYLTFFLSQAGESQMNYIKFLREHPNSCDCGICFSPETKLFRFFTAVIYARYVYLDDEFSEGAKRTIFKQLLAYWESNRNDKSKFPRNDMFYLMSARMLLYMGHYFWKHENDKDAAVTLLKRGSKGLEKVKHGVFLIKQDLELQINSMEETIKETLAPREKKYIRIKCSFEDEPSANGASALNKNLNGGESYWATPKVNKHPQIRSMKAPPRKPVKPKEISSTPKPAERPKRHLIPTIFIDLDSSDSGSAKEKK